MVIFFIPLPKWVYSPHNTMEFFEFIRELKVNEYNQLKPFFRKANHRIETLIEHSWTNFKHSVNAFDVSLYFVSYHQLGRRIFSTCLHTSFRIFDSVGVFSDVISYFFSYTRLGRHIFRHAFVLIFVCSTRSAQFPHSTTYSQHCLGWKGYPLIRFFIMTQWFITKRHECTNPVRDAVVCCHLIYGHGRVSFRDVPHCVTSSVWITLPSLIKYVNKGSGVTKQTKPIY